MSAKTAIIHDTDASPVLPIGSVDGIRFRQAAGARRAAGRLGSGGRSGAGRARLRLRAAKVSEWGAWGGLARSYQCPTWSYREKKSGKPWKRLMPRRRLKELRPCLSTMRSARTWQANSCKKGLTCPHCRMHSKNIRFIDKVDLAKSYFICRSYGRSFSPSAMST